MINKEFSRDSRNHSGRDMLDIKSHHHMNTHLTYVSFRASFVQFDWQAFDKIFPCSSLIRIRLDTKMHAGMIGNT